MAHLPAVAVLFPGQGSQYPGMADPWTDHPEASSILDEASAAMDRDIVAGCHDAEALATTEFVQPALLACDVAAFRVLDGEGVSVVGVAGHSLGQFAVLVAADVLSLADALDLVIVRGAAMQRAGEERPGAMTAFLGIDADDAASLCDEVREDDVLVVANENSSIQVVISGSVPAIERAETVARERRVRAIRLPVSGAFHSPLMEPARAAIDERIDALTFSTPRFPVGENVTGSMVSDPDELRSLLKRHVVSPVRWDSSVRALAEAGAGSFLEAGPGDVLTKLMKRIVPDAAARAIGSPDDALAAAPDAPTAR